MYAQRFVRLNFINCHRAVTYNAAVIRCFSEADDLSIRLNPGAKACIEFVDDPKKYYVTQTYDELEELICLGDVVDV